MQPNTTVDAFLGGRLTITQPARGYRAGVDPVLLAAAVPAQPGDTVLDLGCGVGVAGLCLQARLDGTLQLAGLEREAEVAALARANALENALSFDIITGDVAAMPAGLAAQSFDHVLTNPPYFDRSQGTAATGALREASMGESVPLATWIDAAVRRLRPKGTLTVIHSAKRLPELFAACDTRLGGMCLLPIAAREGREPDRIILHARKGSRGAFRLLPAMVMHQGTRHMEDKSDFSPEIEAVLRDCRALPVNFR